MRTRLLCLCLCLITLFFSIPVDDAVGQSDQRFRNAIITRSLDGRGGIPLWWDGFFYQTYSGTGWDCLFINYTGSGNYILNLQGDGSRVFSVDKSGNVYLAGGAAVGSLDLADTDGSNILALTWNENDTSDRVLNFLVNGADRTINLSDDLVLLSLTNTRLLSTDGTGRIGSSDLFAWVTGTANRVTIADDLDGTITFTTPQDIHTAATPTFAGATFSGLTASKIVLTDGAKALTSAAFTSALLAGQVSDETGSGILVFGTQPVFATDITIGGTDPGTILDVTAAGDTDYWWAVIADGVGDDNDYLKIGKGTTIGTTPFFTWDENGGFKSQNLTDSVTAIQILDADGGDPVFNVDTVNERIGMGTSTPFQKLTLRHGHYIAWETTAGEANSRSWGIRNDYDNYGDFSIRSSNANDNTLDTTRLIIDKDGNVVIYGDLDVTNHLTAFDSSTTVTDWVYADLDGDSQYFYRTDADFPESGITGANDLTIQVWIKLNDIIGTAFIVSKFETAGDKRMYYFAVDGAELRTNFSSDGITGVLKTTSGVNLQAGKWIHVALVYDAVAGTADFYKNGVFVEQETGLPNTIADKDPDFQVGSFNGGSGFFAGGIFNVALFNDKRTAPEILASATDPFENVSGEGNIVGQWMFTESETVAFIDNTESDAGRDLIPYDGGDVLYGACGRTPIKVWNSTSPQFRLTEEADPTKLVDFGVDTNGDLTITTSGDEVFIPEDVIIGAGTKADGFRTKAAAELETSTAVQRTCGSFTLVDENVYQITAIVAAIEDDNNYAGYELKATVYRDGGGATLVGTVTSVHTQETEAAWDATITVNGNDVRISVTGEALTTIQWSSTIQHINVGP